MSDISRDGSTMSVHVDNLGLRLYDSAVGSFGAVLAQGVATHVLSGRGKLVSFATFGGGLGLHDVSTGITTTILQGTHDGVVPTRDQVVGRVEQRLDGLAAFLDGKQYLEGEFSAADLLMTTVLRVLRDTDRVASRPVLRDYQARCEARPAFRRALAAQMDTFARHAPPNA